MVSRGRRRASDAASQRFSRLRACAATRLRSAMCLGGRSWQVSDAIAADVVRSALDLIGAQRPPWLWGQREYTDDSSATRIGYSHCLKCGQRLDDGRLKFCCRECGNALSQ